MSRPLKLIKANASNPKLWIVVGIGVAGVLIVAETQRRRRRSKAAERKDFGAFVERFVVLPFPQPPPPAATHPLAGLTFAIKDMFVFSHSLYFDLVFNFVFFFFIFFIFYLFIFDVGFSRKLLFYLFD
jgi:hypothetical protein